MKETPRFFMRGLLLQKAIWMSEVLGCVPGSHSVILCLFRSTHGFSRSEQAVWTNVLLE